MPELAPGSLIDVGGLLVGHATDRQALTGCTVILVPGGATAGVVVRGLAPGTRETDVLKPGNLVQQIHGLLLTGGSAFGLAAADGVMRYLEEQGVGYDTGVARVPIVPAAVLFDLAIGDVAVRPDAAMGYAASQAAHSGNLEQGNVGAGTGATVGKMLGLGQAMKAGLGTASLRVGNLVVAALVAVNALGDIVDDITGQIIAGARLPGSEQFANSAQLLVQQVLPGGGRGGNTVIGVVATDAQLDRAGARQLASAAHDGLARVCRPAHTLYDGDTIFGLSLGAVEASHLQVCEMAAQVMALAMINAVWAAEDAGGLPCARSVGGGIPPVP